MFNLQVFNVAMHCAQLSLPAVFMQLFLIVFENKIVLGFIGIGSQFSKQLIRIPQQWLTVAIKAVNRRRRGKFTEQQNEIRSNL